MRPGQTGLLERHDHVEVDGVGDVVDAGLEERWRDLPIRVVDQGVEPAGLLDGSLHNSRERVEVPDVHTVGRRRGGPSTLASRRRIWLGVVGERAPRSPRGAEAVPELGRHRDQLPAALEAIGDWLPLSQAIDALNAVARGDQDAGYIWLRLGFIAIWIVVAIVLGSVTLRRRTN